MIGVAPNAGELSQVVSVAHDDERPALLVLRAAGSAAGIQDPVEMIWRQRPLGELPNDAQRVDRVPCLHRSKKLAEIVSPKWLICSL
jgi:hypothetical protein